MTGVLPAGWPGVPPFFFGGSAASTVGGPAALLPDRLVAKLGDGALLDGWWPADGPRPDPVPRPRYAHVSGAIRERDPGRPSARPFRLVGHVQQTPLLYGRGSTMAARSGPSLPAAAPGGGGGGGRIGADVLLALAGGCRRAAAWLCGRLDRSGEPVAHRDLPFMVRKQNVCTR